MRTRRGRFGLESVPTGLGLREFSLYVFFCDFVCVCVFVRLLSTSAVRWTILWKSSLRAACYTSISRFFCVVVCIVCVCVREFGVFCAHCVLVFVFCSVFAFCVLSCARVFLRGWCLV